MTDVFYADQICYINEINDVNEAHAVCFGILNAVNLYQKTFLYRYYDQIKAERVQIQEALQQGRMIIDPDFPQSHYGFQLMHEMVTDNFLIGTFFEVIAKAFILNKGMLVHKIEPTKSAEQAIKDFANEQKNKPVSAKEYIRHDPFADYKGVGRNGLQYVGTETISYGLLYDKEYITELPFSVKFKKDANIFRTLRNQIHFPLAGASEAVIELDEMSDDVHEVIMREIKECIKPRFDSLNSRHEFRFSINI